MSVARRYLDALQAVAVAECDVDDAFAGSEFGALDLDYLGDPYDASLEVFAPGLAPEKVEALGVLVLSLGFGRCWIHLHEGKRDRCSSPKCDRERYFAAATRAP